MKTINKSKRLYISQDFWNVLKLAICVSRVAFIILKNIFKMFIRYNQKWAERRYLERTHQTPLIFCGAGAPFHSSSWSGRDFLRSSVAVHFKSNNKVIRWKLWKMWYRFRTSNLQRYKFIQVETRTETTNLAVGTFPDEMRQPVWWKSVICHKSVSQFLQFSSIFVLFHVFH